MPAECRCRLGWAGPTCKECQVLPGCQHGSCTKPLECKCHPGWTGILCHIRKRIFNERFSLFYLFYQKYFHLSFAIAICAKNCSQLHGYCKKPGECRCKVGWQGDNCNECHVYPKCKHGDCRRPWECNCK